MKTAELTGALLDYWAAYTTDAHKDAHRIFPTMTLDSTFSGIVLRDYPRGEHGSMLQSCVLIPNNAFRQDPQPFAPSEYWEHGGPLVEKEKLYLEWDADGYWTASHPDSRQYKGLTPLVAAMRAVVAGHFGDDVPDEVPA